MALVTPTTLKTMDYAFQGQPFVDVPAKDTVDIKTMDYAYRAQPFVRNYGAAAVGINMQINIGDVWKDATGIQINIGDVWKTVTKVELNVGDVWKTIF